MKIQPVDDMSSLYAQPFETISNEGSITIMSTDKKGKIRDGAFVTTQLRWSKIYNYEEILINQTSLDTIQE